jgi:2-C-methyl-D-erythritol 4-phosphate cytidylyltransferase
VLKKTSCFLLSAVKFYTTRHLIISQITGKSTYTLDKVNLNVACLHQIDILLAENMLMIQFKSIALIPAAGMGKRMGASVNKQYLLLDGMPIVARTISVFEQSSLIDAIYLVIPAEEIPYCREHVVEEYRFCKIAAIIPGGKERQQSVMNGLRGMREHVADDDVVLIHDGVRPLITEEMLRESIAVASSYDGAVMAVQAKDTIKSVENGIVTGTPDRRTLWQAQTPQTFRYSVIYSAHQAAETDHYLGTDDSSLVERTGGHVRIVRGNYNNIKITTPEDLILAEAFLASARKTRTHNG